MKEINFSSIVKEIKGCTVERPNKRSSGTLSGHAAGEPFEKKVYQLLKLKYKGSIFKQYEYLNDLFLKHPKAISAEDRLNLFNSPTAMYLLSRGTSATEKWNPEHIFEERQNDTADILYYADNRYNLIDVKTRNVSKSAQPPNIISSYKLAKACATMIDNEEYDTIGINYIEIDWIEDGDNLRCTDAHHADLFKTNPDTLYINWAAGMQIQFHVADLNQSWIGDRETWARHYIKVFVESAKRRCSIMENTYIKPFLKYID